MTTTTVPRDPAERRGTPVDGVRVRGALSPSRAGDFLSCPLLYRFRSIDRLPEPPSPAAVRGTLVHRVLELLFDDPAPARTLARSVELLAPCWVELQEAEPAVASMFAGDDAEERLSAWLASCEVVLRRYFDLEDPTSLEPAERELYVEALTDAGLLLRGVVDRVDVAPDGSIQVVDYKTGASPSEFSEARALFQLKFYALVLLHVRGVIPSMLRLIYLGNGEVLSYAPDEHELRATERKAVAVWDAIAAATAARHFEPRKGRGCDWCAHRALCPAWGGTPPPFPEPHGVHGASPEDDAAEPV